MKTVGPDRAQAVLEAIAGPKWNEKAAIEHWVEIFREKWVPKR